MLAFTAFKVEGEKCALHIKCFFYSMQRVMNNAIRTILKVWRKKKKGEDFEVNTGMEWQEKVFHQCQLLKNQRT